MDTKLILEQISQIVSQINSDCNKIRIHLNNFRYNKAFKMSVQGCENIQKLDDLFNKIAICSHKKLEGDTTKKRHYEPVPDSRIRIEQIHQKGRHVTHNQEEDVD